MTVTTNPVVTGIPTSPFVQNAQVTTNGNVTGISATSDGIASTAVTTNPTVTGHVQNRSVRQALTNLLGDGSTIANYQPGVGITGTLNASAWANQIGAAPSLDQATGTNQPAYLPFNGERYVWNNNVASNTISCSAKVIVGNLTMAFDVALNDYTPAANVLLFNKLLGNNGFQLILVNTTGVLRLRIGNGAAVTIIDSTVAVGLTDETRHTIGVVWTDGVGADFTIDGVALGANVPAAVTLTNAVTATLVGPWPGKIYDITITDGASTIYYQAQPFAVAEGATTWIGAGGETWTVNSAGSLPVQVVGSASLLADGTAYKMATANFTLNQPVTEYIVAKQISWTAGDYLASGTAGAAGITSTTGTPNISLNAGAAAAENTGATVGAYHVLTATFNGASSALGVDSNAETTGNAGAGNPGGISLFSDNAGANYGNWQVKEVIVRNVADSAATKAKIQAALKAIHGTP